MALILSGAKFYSWHFPPYFLSLVEESNSLKNNVLDNHLQKARIKLEGNGPIDIRATVVEVSAANLNFIVEISNLIYPCTDVHVASNSLLGSL